MSMDTVRRLISSFEDCTGKGDAVSETAKEGLHYLSSLKCDVKNFKSCHELLCAAMIKAMKGGGRETGDLLNYAGPEQTLRVVYSNVSQSTIQVAKWLSHEVLELILSGRLTELFIVQAHHTPQLSPSQEQLVGVVCRLPDCLANRLGRQLSPRVLPRPYFERVGISLVECLTWLCGLESGEECSVLFFSAIIGKAILLGHKESILGPLLPVLEDHVISNAAWRRISQSLFSHVPSAGLEGMLEMVVQTITISLNLPSPIHSLLGNLALTNSKAQFILTHKFVLVRVLSGQKAVYNLISYLSACVSAPSLLGKSLGLALEVWSDRSALRHMDNKQHLWISKLIVLGVNFLQETDLLNLKPRLQQLTMAGIEAHIESPLQDIRHVGMAVGEFLMNKFNPIEQLQKLSFEYEPSEEITVLQTLSRPLAEQQTDLKGLERNKVVGVTQVEQDKRDESLPRFGEGLVKTVECSDSDSDDDLTPYSMADDPDSSAPSPPQYLRTLIEGLLCTKEPQRMEVALQAAERLIRREPSDLHEVATELTKILLHLSNSFALPDFSSLRLKSLVAVTVLSPRQVAPYLTGQFYAPNYNLRQRIDMLEVIGEAALELSQPLSTASSPEPSLIGHGKLRKEWQKVIDERLKNKTRVISKGPTRMPPKPAPNRFADVASLFFFPLMSRYDRSMTTVNLLGEDSLVLGNLLFTLGTVMYATVHATVAPVMGVALLDFLWAVRYHSAAYVRQGVLFSMAMVFTTTPHHTLLAQMDSRVTEAVQWVVGVVEEDPDDQCRALARHTLSMFESTMKQVLY